MPQEYSPQSRAERLIATGRMILVAFSLVAVFADPSPPPQHALLVRVLVGYAVFAALVALVEVSLRAPLARFRVVTHCLDLAAFALFLLLADGPTGQFVVYFVFSLVAATLRWQVRGTAWTAVAALAIFLGAGLLGGPVMRDPDLHVNRFLIQWMSLAVVAAMLAYMGAFEERARREMTRLSAWPRAMPCEIEALARELLEHAAGVLGGRRMAVAWEGTGDPWRHLAWRAGPEVQVRREDADGEPLVAEPLAGVSFLCPDASGPTPLVLLASSSGLQRWRGAALPRPLQARFQPSSILALRLAGQTASGRLFAFDRPDLTSDDLVLGEIVARQVAARLDHFYLAQRLQDHAAAEERLRLARDLHDGVLQTLAGVALQLESIAALVHAAPEEAGRRLRQSQRAIAGEQADLRAFIRRLRPQPLGSAGPGRVPARLAELARRVAREWGLDVDLVGAEALQGLPEPLAHEAFRVVQEALMNAARHAEARRVRIRLDAESDRLRVTVEDDGHGLAFGGRRDLATLQSEARGPRVLRERVEALGGELFIDSTTRGTRLDVRLPRERAPAAGLR